MKKIFLLILVMCGIIQLYGREYSMDYVGKRTKLFYKGTQIDFRRCAQEQLRRYPDSQIRDWVKMAYQAAYGAAHGVANRSENILQKQRRCFRLIRSY